MGSISIHIQGHFFFITKISRINFQCRERNKLKVGKKGKFNFLESFLNFFLKQIESGTKFKGFEPTNSDRFYKK